MNAWKQHPLAVRMSAYETFADIPPEDQHEEALIAWLRTPEGKIAEIPRDLLTRKMQVAAVRTAGSLCNLSFSDTPDYREIALEAIVGSSVLILQVDEEALNEPFLYAAVSIGHSGHLVLRTMILECCDRFNRLITPRIIAKGLANSLAVASEILLTRNVPIPQSIKDMVNDNVLREALRYNTGETYYLKRLGKLHLLTEAINDEYWPSLDTWMGRRAPDVLAKKPDLSVAIAKRMRADTSNLAMGLFDRHFHAFFEAVILTFPIEEVLSQLTSREHVSLLKELYSTEALMPYLRNYPHLKTMVLEDAMGL